MKKITITEDDEFNKRYPQSLPCRMTITLKSGEQKTAELSNPDRPSRPPDERRASGGEVPRPGGAEAAAGAAGEDSRSGVEDRERRRLAVAVRRVADLDASFRTPHSGLIPSITPVPMTQTRGLDPGPRT